MSDDRAELLAAIKAKAVVRGDFVLSSGQRADFYVDLRRILLDGRVAPLAGRVMLDLTADLATTRPAASPWAPTRSPPR